MAKTRKFEGHELLGQVLARRSGDEYEIAFHDEGFDGEHAHSQIFTEEELSDLGNFIHDLANRLGKRRAKLEKKHV